MREKNFENQVKNFLRSKQIYRLGEFNGQKSNGYYLKRWGGGQYIPAGIPDMQICVGTTCLEVELKTDTGVVSELQKLKIKQINNAGGFAIVLRPRTFKHFKYMIDFLVHSGSFFSQEVLNRVWYESEDRNEI